MRTTECHSTFIVYFFIVTLWLFAANKDVYMYNSDKMSGFPDTRREKTRFPKNAKIAESVNSKEKNRMRWRGLVCAITRATNAPAHALWPAIIVTNAFSVRLSFAARGTNST